MGATVDERLACSPPAKAIRAQSPAGPLPEKIRCLSAGFLGNLPFPPTLHFGAAPYSSQSPSSALKISIYSVDRAKIKRGRSISMARAPKREAAVAQWIKKPKVGPHWLS
ncbi:hypothetical protein PR048_027240, partial [Dryococelus australis]